MINGYSIRKCSKEVGPHHSIGGIKLDDFDRSTEGELILTAKINNEIAGFVSILEEDKFIHNLFVSSNFKSCGVGKGTLLFNEI